MHGRPSLLTRHLDATDALGEVLFGLIMVLTFTVGAGLIVQESEDAAGELLWGILGCNVAWGVIDAAMYVMNCLLERSRKSRLVASLRKTTHESDALAVIGNALDDRLEPLATPEERERFYHELLRRLRSHTAERVRVQKSDLLGAFTCFVLVVVSTVPAIAPFLFIRDRFVALRVSNLLLLVMMFYVGYRWARAAHVNAWLLGSVLTLGGVILVVIAIALGG